MASEASWQTSATGGLSEGLPADEPMDQRTVETLLRRLVERVEESERRYGEALNEFHARLDQLSQTTEAARETGAPEDNETFERLHTQVSNLTQKLESENAASLDDFERLGRALSSGPPNDRADDEANGAPEPFEHEPAPSAFAQAAEASKTGSGLAPSTDLFGADTIAPAFSFDPASIDKRLVEMAERLEQSIGAAMPASAIETLNARIEDIGSQLSRTLERAPSREALEQVEKQIFNMGQQLNRAEEQLGKFAGVEQHLHRLIERLDQTDGAAHVPVDPVQLQEIAARAATEAARIVADDSKKTTERLDALHRDITAMSDKSRDSGDRMVSTLEAVHESLKELVQQVERGNAFMGARPPTPFTDRARQAEARPAAPFATPLATPLARQPSAPQAVPQAAAPQATAPQPPASQPQMAGAAPRMPDMRPSRMAAPARRDEAADVAVKDQSLRDRLGAAIPDLKEMETPPPFGRASQSSPTQATADLDAKTNRQGHASAAAESPDNLVAAARRAARAATARTEERDGRRSRTHLSESVPSAEPGRRKRSLLIISAATLLAVSAILLYGRLSSKPEVEAVPTTTGETTPAPAGTDADAATPQSAPQTAPEAAPQSAPEESGSWTPLPDPDRDPMEFGQATGLTEIAKSGHRPIMPPSELSPEPRLASLKSGDEAALSPGVFFSVEEPGVPAGTQVTAPMPPAALGPLSLRKAASEGDVAAQYEIGIRYADGKGTKRDLKTAAEWLERAGRGGLAPAQYRLAAMFERGQGVGKDLDKAQAWYKTAAEKGNVKAMHNLAVSVSGRDGNAPDYDFAAKWYGQAAGHGLPDSQFNLGILAEHGLGTTKNPGEAYKWYSLAAAQGDGEALKRRDAVAAQLTPETRAKVEAEVTAWKAAPALPKANDVPKDPSWTAIAANAPAANAPAAPQGTSLVSRAQTLLNKLGYDVGPPDGLLGSRTRAELKRFQQRNGMDETGEVTIPLVTKLEHLTS